MCLLAFLRRVFVGSVPPKPEGFLSPEDEQRAAQQAYVSLGKPGSLGFFRRVSTTSARLAPLRLPLLRRPVVEESLFERLWSPPQTHAVSEDSVISLDPSGTHECQHEYRRSCGRPCERPPRPAEQRRTADRDAQEVIVPIFVRIHMGRASPLSAVDDDDDGGCRPF